MLSFGMFGIAWLGARIWLVPWSIGMPFIGALFLSFGIRISLSADAAFSGFFIGFASRNLALGSLAAGFLAGGISFMSIVVPSGMVIGCADAEKLDSTSIAAIAKV